MAKYKAAERVTVSCPGCGRTQTVRKSKVVPCNYYTCSRSCKANPEWQHPAKPKGFVHVQHMYAAGAFTGHEFRPATEEEQESINRAKLIFSAGLLQISEPN
ncbi:hypothetical protein AFK68_13830 [Hydrocoleum sp. CS-953]|nr:hypothetical protein AFK68_13830 [Hydrocoleum sp. CS-953]